MLKLKVHTKPISPYTDIDKYILVPKKIWDEFQVGSIEILINGSKVQTRVYDVFCDCVGEKHSHRIIDLREQFDGLDLKENQEVIIS